jgi:hypothetical protein
MTDRTIELDRQAAARAQAVRDQAIAKAQAALRQQKAARAAQVAQAQAEVEAATPVPVPIPVPAAIQSKVPLDPNEPIVTQVVQRRVYIIATNVAQPLFPDGYVMEALVAIMPDPSNTSTAYLGVSGSVSSSSGYPLPKTQTVPLYFASVYLKDLFLVGTTGDSVHVLGA